MRNKKELIEAFREISTLEENQFKSRAYLRSIIHLQAMSDEEFNERKTFLNLPGIGQSINSKILSFKATGNLPEKLFKLREENRSYLDPQLYKVRKGFITKRISYSEASRIVDQLTSEIELAGINPSNIYFLGSYRRHKSLIADLDILTDRDTYLELVRFFDDYKGVKRLVSGSTKTSYVLNNVEKTSIDISWCDKDQLPFSILHFTGSAAHNIRLRAKAQDLGYKLNQYGIYDEWGNMIEHDFLNEEDIFDFLGEEYISPENR